jgi:hypothetical protein
MDNLQFWIYIIIAVIYAVSRAIKKGKQSAEQVRPERKDFETSEDGGGSGEVPMTFEDLLREITEAKKPKSKEVTYTKPEKPVSKPQPAYVDYDDDLKDEAETLEDVNYDYRNKDKVYDIYEKAKQDAFLRPSLEESLAGQKKDMDYGRFKEFSIIKRSSVLDEYVAELKKPSGFKKAVVMSEILNRRF